MTNPERYIVKEIVFWIPHSFPLADMSGPPALVFLALLCLPHHTVLSFPGKARTTFILDLTILQQQRLQSYLLERIYDCLLIVPSGTYIVNIGSALVGKYWIKFNEEEADLRGKLAR